MTPTTNATNHPLLNDSAISNEGSEEKNWKPCFIFLLVLLILIPVTFGLTELIWYLYGDPPNNATQNYTTIITSTETTVTSIRTATEIVTTKSRYSPPQAGKCGKRIVGYYTEWEPRKMKASQLKKLTHLIFTNIPMNATGYINYENSSQRRRFLEMRRMAKSKNSDAKVMFSIGGHLNSQYLSGIVADSEFRKKFIESIIYFMKTNQLDGVDIFWNWPGSNDMDNFVTFIRELRGNLTTSATSVKPYLLSFCAPPTVSDYEQYFDLNKFLDHVDFINVVAFYYYAPWFEGTGKYVGPNAPLYGGNRGNVDETMHYLVCRTKKPSKLNMAISFYGRYWKRVNTNETDEMWKTAELVDGIAEGSFVTWRDLKRNEWISETTWHEETKTPYVWKPNDRIFFVFENERSLKEKMDYVTDNNLGGIYIWALGADDDEDTLLNTVSSVDLCEGGRGDTMNFLCEY